MCYAESVRFGRQGQLWASGTLDVISLTYHRHPYCHGHCAITSHQIVKIMQCTSKTVLGNVLNTSVRRGPSLPPSFLLPAFAKTQTAAFSSSPVSAARKDNNTRRGMSAIRRTGLNKRFKLSVKLEDLPQPVLDPKKRSKLEVDDDHGLWGFFDDKKSSLLSPEVLISHGRGWKRSELRRKSWEDLWKLWWTCIREVNRVKTYEKERKRLNAGYGEYEATARVQEVRGHVPRCPSEYAV